MLRRVKHTLCAQDQRPHGDWTELCLSVSCGGTGQLWPATGAGALGAAVLGMALALLEEVTINPTTEPPELTQDCGNRLLEGTSRTLCTRTQEKGAVTSQGTDPDLPECPGVTDGGVGQWWTAAGSGALSVAVPTWYLLKEVAIIVITSTIVWPQVKQ